MVKLASEYFAVINGTDNGLYRRVCLKVFPDCKINLGQLGRTIGSVAQTARAISRALNINNPTLRENQTAYDALIRDELWPLVKNKDGSTQNFFIEKKNYVDRAQKSLDLAKLRGKLHNNFFTKPYPSIEEDYRSGESYTDDVQTNVGSINGIVSARYMKDPMNFDVAGKTVFTAKLLDGVHDTEDFIKFKIFADFFLFFRGEIFRNTCIPCFHIIRLA